MANNPLDFQVFLPTGDPKTSVHAVTDLYGPYSGPTNLGKVIPFNGKRYQKCQLENSTLTETPAVKKPIFWKDRANKVVTFDIADSEAGGNACAGTIETGATVPAAGEYFWVLQEAVDLTVNGAALNFSTKGNIWPTAAGGGTFSFTALGTATTYNSCGTVSTTVDRSGGAGDVVVDFNVPSAL